MYVYEISTDIWYLCVCIYFDFIENEKVLKMTEYLKIILTLNIHLYLQI